MRPSWEVVLRGCPGRSSWEDVLGGHPGRSTWEVILRGCPGRSSWKVIPGFLSINFLFWADIYTWNERVSSFIVLCRDIQCLPNPFLRSFLMVSSWNIMDNLESSHSFASNCKVFLRGAITQVLFSWAYWAETLQTEYNSSEDVEHNCLRMSMFLSSKNPVQCKCLVVHATRPYSCSGNWEYFKSQNHPRNKMVSNRKKDQ